MNDIKIDKNMKRALDLFASFDFELQGITLENINNLSNGNSYATYHNNYVQKLSDKDKHIFMSKIYEMYDSSLKDEKSVKLFHSEMNKIWNIEEKKFFLDSLINIDKNDFPENIKNTRNLLLTKYSSRVKEKIINNILKDLKYIKEDENIISNEDPVKIKKEDKLSDFINLFEQLENNKKNRVILSGYLGKLTNSYDLPENIYKLIFDLKEMSPSDRINIYSNVIKPYMEKNNLEQVYLTQNELKKANDFMDKIDILNFEDKFDFMMIEVHKEKSSKINLKELSIELKELNEYQRNLVIDDLLKKTEVEIKNKKEENKGKIPNSNSLFGRIKNKLFAIDDNNIENKNDGPKM